MDVDLRFARFAQDPRFRKISRKERKVKIDGRFNKMFTDKGFTTNYFVDKRGSKVKKTSKEDLRKFYAMSDESDQEDEKTEPDVEEHQDDKKDKRQKKGSESKRKRGNKDVEGGTSDVNREVQGNDKESDDEGISKMEDRDKVKDDDNGDSDSSSAEEVDIGRGEGDLMSSSDEEDDEGLDFQKAQNEIEHPWGEMNVSTKTTQETTRRLALCNLDWDKVTATDLFVLFNSLKPRDGTIEAVKIYPSDYGLEQMRSEETLGPVPLKDEEADDEKNIGNKESVEIQKPKSARSKKVHGSEFSMEKLRQYQLNRLKYFYAVIECDTPDQRNKTSPPLTPETAGVLYEGCDGIEFELSGNLLDLRYIPDDMEFDHEPQSVATELPASGSYIAPEFSTTALHQTNVKLTWDETDPGRQRTTMRKFNKDEILEMDFNAYLASSSDEEELEGGEENSDGKEESDEDEDKKINKYKQLLREIENKEHKADREQELEITWEPGLREATEELVTNKIKEKEKKKMAPWEIYLQNKKEKRKEKRMEKESLKKRLSGRESDESYDVPSDVDLSDPFFSREIDAGIKCSNEDDKKTSAKPRGKRKHGDVETEEDKKAKEELELLLMEDKDDRQHFSLKGIMDSEKKMNKKRRKRKEKEEEIVEDDFNVDLKDSRFDALFTSHHFAVDPSDPQYRKTKAMETIIQERQKRRETGEITPKANHEKEVQSKKRDPSLSALIKSVKSKTGHFHDRKQKKILMHS